MAAAAAAAEELTSGIKDLLTIEIKPRHDTISDQYSRIFMVRLLLVCTIIIGVNEYKDTISCIIPESLDICNQGDDDPSCNFINGACWIQGMYVYKQLVDKVDNVAYFGMPKNMDSDGYVKGTEDLCQLTPKLGVEKSENCLPMEKTFFLQYQYMAFLVAALGLTFYLPYIIFCRVNKDMIELKALMKSKDEIAKAGIILESYFNHGAAAKMPWLRPLLNVVIKALYVCSNIISFLVLDSILNGEYLEYGIRWLEWSRMKNSVMYDYMGMRDFPKPGNRLLPPFGYCEFYESARDIKQSKSNKIKLVCEISQHVLFQYCLLLLWYCIVGGIIISLLGLIHQVGTYLSTLATIKSKRFRKAGITLRQMDYIHYIRSKDKEMHQEILSDLFDGNEEREVEL